MIFKLLGNTTHTLIFFFITFEFPNSTKFNSFLFDYCETQPNGQMKKEIQLYMKFTIKIPYEADFQAALKHNTHSIKIMKIYLYINFIIDFPNSTKFNSFFFDYWKRNTRSRK